MSCGVERATGKYHLYKIHIVFYMGAGLLADIIPVYPAEFSILVATTLVCAYRNSGLATPKSECEPCPLLELHSYRISIGIPSIVIIFP